MYRADSSAQASSSAMNTLRYLLSSDIAPERSPLAFCITTFLLSANYRSQYRYHKLLDNVQCPLVGFLKFHRKAFGPLPISLQLQDTCSKDDPLSCSLDAAFLNQRGASSQSYNPQAKTIDLRESKVVHLERSKENLFL